MLTVINLRVLCCSDTYVTVMNLQNNNLEIRVQEANEPNEEQVVMEEKVCESFDDMDLKDSLLRGIYAYGFEKPSAIQQQAIMPAIKGRDLIAQAQSGTGKTATFAISILQMVDKTRTVTQAVVVAPTRELATQVSVNIKSTWAWLPNLKHCSAMLLRSASKHKPLKVVL